MTQNSANSPLCHRKPDISYPCTWEYKVIGTNREQLEKVIIESCKPAVAEIVLSNVSSNGKYYSLNATLTVDTEEMRNTIFNLLQSNPAVKMVI